MEMVANDGNNNIEAMIYSDREEDEEDDEEYDNYTVNHLLYISGGP